MAETNEFILFFLFSLYFIHTQTQTQIHMEYPILFFSLIRSTIHILIFPLLPFPNIISFLCIISPFFSLLLLPRKSHSISNTVKNELDWVGVEGTLYNKNKKRRNRNDMYCEKKCIEKEEKKKKNPLWKFICLYTDTSFLIRRHAPPSLIFFLFIFIFFFFCLCQIASILNFYTIFHVYMYKFLHCICDNMDFFHHYVEL